MSGFVCVSKEKKTIGNATFNLLIKRESDRSRHTMCYIYLTERDDDTSESQYRLWKKRIFLSIFPRIYNPSAG